MRHADEARRAFEQALRSARARFDAAERKPTGASRTIARRAVHFELEELIEIEAQLEAIEARVAERIAGLCDPRDHRRFRLAE